jgi:hypothetical protein
VNYGIRTDGGITVKRKLIKAALMVGLLAGAGLTKPTEAYVRCITYNGTSCTTPGSSFRCYNQYPDEPGACICNNNYVYVCG